MDYNEMILRHSFADVADEYLCHHGIKGQKWGIRRFQNTDGSLTAAGKDRYGYGSSDGKSFSTKLVEKHNDRIKEHNRQALSDKNEDHHAKDSNNSALFLAGRIAYHAVATLANPVNAVYLAGDLKRLGDAAVSSLKSSTYESERQQGEIDLKTGFRKKSREYTEEEDLKRVNPEFKNFNTNTKSNCMLCTMTYDMRRRGFDVTAQKASVGYNYDTLKSFYPGVKIENVGNTLTKGSDGKYMKHRDLTEKTISALAAQGNGARGNLMVQWNVGGGHSMAYEVKDGKVRILDGQTGKVTKNPNRILNQVYDVSYARLDNLEPDYKKIKEVCR